MLVVSLAFNFPFCYRNRQTFGADICNPKYRLYTEEKKIFARTDKKRKLKYRPRNPNLLAISRFICDSLMIIVSIALVGIFYKMKDDDNKENFNNINPSGEVENIKKLLLPNICLSSVHNMPLYLLLPFINDAYYYREDY